MHPFHEFRNLFRDGGRHRHPHHPGCREADRESRHAAGFGGHRGFGHGRGGRHSHDGDGASFGRRIGRLFERGDLRLLILWFIEQQPRHGYELIRLIEELSGGSYAPSPGAIYPTLTLLEEEGHVEVDESSGNRKRYALTDPGRQLVEANRAAIEAVIANIRVATRMAAKMSVPDDVVDAMRRLKGALLAHPRDWDEAEARRVTAIVDDALARVVAGAADSTGGAR